MEDASLSPQEQARKVIGSLIDGFPDRYVIQAMRNVLGTVTWQRNDAQTLESIQSILQATLEMVGKDAMVEALKAVKFMTL